MKVIFVLILSMLANLSAFAQQLVEGGLSLRPGYGHGRFRANDNKENDQVNSILSPAVSYEQSIKGLFSVSGGFHYRGISGDIEPYTATIVNLDLIKYFPWSKAEPSDHFWLNEFRKRVAIYGQIGYQHKLSETYAENN